MVSQAAGLEPASTDSMTAAEAAPWVVSKAGPYGRWWVLFDDGQVRALGGGGAVTGVVGGI